MGLFGRKKDDDEDEKDFGEPIKKLAPKKEPPKPWGKKERFIVGFFFFGTVLASGILAIYARSWKLPNFPRLSFSGINFFQGEKIVLEGGTQSKGASLQRSKDVVAKFNDQTQKLSGVWGLYVYDIKNDFSFGVNENEEFQAASLIKLPLMTMLYDLAQQDKLDLTTEHILTKADKVNGAGSLYQAPVGTKIVLEDLIKLMGNQSDNTAFNICLNLVGKDALEEYIKSIDLPYTSYETNMTTPADIGRFFKTLHANKLVDVDNTNKILGYLTNTSYENHLAVGIAEGVTIAHKYGREVHVVNDAGVVYAKDPFVVVIMSKGIVETEADIAFPALSTAIFEEFQK